MHRYHKILFPLKGEMVSFFRFWRIFYETFGDDAVTASKVLGIIKKAKLSPKLYFKGKVLMAIISPVIRPR